MEKPRLKGPRNRGFSGSIGGTSDGRETVTSKLTLVNLSAFLGASASSQTLCSTQLSDYPYPAHHC